MLLPGFLPARKMCWSSQIRVFIFFIPFRGAAAGHFFLMETNRGGVKRKLISCEAFE